MSKAAARPQPQTRVIIADSESDANLYWATRFLVPDPVIFVEHRKKKYLLLNDLEVDRGRKEASVDRVLSYSDLERKSHGRNGKRPGMMDVLGGFLKGLGVKEMAVPYNFPLAHAQALSERKFKLRPQGDPFYAERVFKTDAEKNAIKASLKYTSMGIQEAYRMLRESKIRGERLLYRGELLTSELLKRAINLKLMEHNCIGKNTIVASGNQAVDPHCQGYGPIRPHQLIVMDVFPRSMDTQYFGDMTRTVVKGKASDAMKKLWHTVKWAQENAIGQVREGVDGQKIHEDILKYFEKQGYKTGVMKGRMQGFFHGTGHGLGLDIHEAPRVSRVSHVLKARSVVTVEPGLYYHGLGGVRIEDVVFVKKNGCEVLSKCPKILEIP